MMNPNSSEGKQVKDVKTKTYLQLEATQRLYRAHHQLNNIKIELKLNAEIWDDQDSTHRKLANITWNIRKFIVRALSNSKVSDVLNKSGKIFATIASVKVICHRNEWKMTKDIVNPANKWHSLDIQMLESYTSNSIVTTLKRKKEKQNHNWKQHSGFMKHITS